MSDSNNSPPRSPPRRRSSFAGQTFADLFGARPRTNTGGEAAGSPPNPNGPITAAAAQASRRRLSLTTLGLSGAGNNNNGPASPFGSLRGRRESISSANSGSIDESAIEDEPSTGTTPQQSQPTTPFARRMSFGARALRDVKAGEGNKGNGSPPQTSAGVAGGRRKLDAPTAAKSRGLSSSIYSYRITARLRPGHFADRLRFLGDGFNWSDNFRSRAERSSIGGAGGTMTGAAPAGGGHSRAKSVATMEQPVREAPKPVNVPDHFQERILKGDFYMD